MAIDPRSEEEKRKRREAFEQNRAKLSLGGNQPAGFMGAGALAQAAPKAPVIQPAQVSPQIATNIASSQREQNIAQQQKTQLQQRATRDADVFAARQNAQKIVGLPAAQQPQAVAAMQTAVRPNAQTQATPNIKPSANPAVKPVMGMVPPSNNIARPAVANAVAKSVADTVTPAKSLLDDEASATNPIYSEGVTLGNPNNKKVGLSVDNNAAVAQPLAPQMGGGNSARGFGVMAAPRKAYGEDSRRQALVSDIRPYAKMGGRLTTGQIALKNAIINGDDEKYANEQYQGQLSAAQKLAQEGMTQSGANSRAQLTESGANSRAELSELGANTRADNQLGFDAEKFQQIAALDSRKLDMQQSNDNVSNFAPKRLNGLYEKYDAAETDEERSAIASQIQSLSGTSKPQSPVLVNNTGQTATGDSMAPLKDNAAMLYLPDSREWVQPPTAERTPSDPPMLALQQNSKLSEKEKGEAYDTYMNGGDISSYLQ